MENMEHPARNSRITAWRVAMWEDATRYLQTCYEQSGWWGIAKTLIF